MAGPRFFQITPLMPVPDMEAALNGFALLGFVPEFRQWTCADVTRSGVSVRVPKSRDPAGAPFPAHRGFACYVDVEDVDAVHAELAPRLTAAGAEFVGPVNKTCRQRELLTRAPDGNVFVFGAPIGQGAS